MVERGVDAPPAGFLVASVEGRGFTRLLRRRPELEGALDLRVRDVLIATADQLMNCELRVVYAHTQSDEISLLLHVDEARREPAQIVSILAGEASAKFTLLLGELACFKCRLDVLPDLAAVVEHFRERQLQAERSAVAAHCEYALRRTQGDAVGQGEQPEPDDAGRRALLRSLGVDLEALPMWQRRGVGLWWAQHALLRPPEAASRSSGPIGVPLPALRRRVRVELELPVGDEYAELVRTQAQQAAAPGPLTAG